METENGLRDGLGDLPSTFCVKYRGAYCKAERSRLLRSVWLFRPFDSLRADVEIHYSVMKQLDKFWTSKSAFFAHPRGFPSGISGADSAEPLI